MAITVSRIVTCLMKVETQNALKLIKTMTKYFMHFIPKKFLIACSFFLSATGILIAQSHVAEPILESEETSFTTLVWSDEFDGSGAPDPEKWFHQTQLPPGGSWWGGIIQH